MFQSTINRDTSFLSFLKKQLNTNEFVLLANEAGFSDPNTFTVEKVMRPLIDLEFPQKDHYEYLWAIYECNIPQLNNYSRWMKMYISALYIYCNKIKIWGIRIESDFYFLVLNDELKGSDMVGAKQFINYIEWLCDCVSADDGYDDYYCLLSWVFFRRLLNFVNDNQFQIVIENLISKNYTKEIISELTVSERAAESWFSLHQCIPIQDCIASINWRKIILGE